MTLTSQGLGGVSEGQQKRPLLDQVKDRLRVLHYALRTEQAYVDWIKRFILFHGKRHPKDMGAAEVEAFLPSGCRSRILEPSLPSPIGQELIRERCTHKAC